jgi:hypothetical protein
VPLDNHQVASRLSYFLWASMPDAALFAAADAQQLLSPQQIQTQARRMLQSPRARAVIEDFHLRWLGLDELPSVERSSPLFSPSLVRSMLEETRRFVGDAAFAPQGSGLEQLLTASRGYVDPPLARLYGVAAPPGPALVPRDLDPRQRAGLFTQASFLTRYAEPTTSAPIARGRILRERLLCVDIPPPPPPADVPLPQPRPGETTRARVTATIASEAACSACHQLMDPLGFAFEHYDALGAWRATEEGLAVDSSGDVEPEYDSGNHVKFADAVELMQALSRQPVVSQCLVTQWFRYAMHRRENEQGESTSLKAIHDVYRSARFDMRELLVAIASSVPFRFRAPATGEQR